MVEGGDDNLVLQTVFHNQVINLLFDAVVFVVAGLDFDVGYDVSILNQFEVLSQSGDILGFTLTCELERNIALLQFFKGHVLNQTGCIDTSTVNAFVMNDNDFAVLGQMNVQFNTVAAFGFNCLAESQHRVFGIITAKASVGKILNHDTFLQMSLNLRVCNYFEFVSGRRPLTPNLPNCNSMVTFYSNKFKCDFGVVI